MALEYLQRLSQLLGEQRHDEAVKLSEEAAQRFPDDERILRARAIILRRALRPEEAEEFLTGVIERKPRAWAHAQLGVLLQHRDSLRAIPQLRSAHQLEPGSLDYRLALAQALSRTGDGKHLDEAYDVLKPVLGQARTWPPNNLHIAYNVLLKVCAYDELDRLGSPRTLGRMWAAVGNHTGLFLLLGRPSAPDGCVIEGAPSEDALT